MASVMQGCLVQFTKSRENMQNDNKIYPLVNTLVKISKRPQYKTTFLIPKVLQNIPKVGFLVWKYTIRQPEGSNQN
jgi:hypothetical protein